jgi:hypothetical protein
MSIKPQYLPPFHCFRGRDLQRNAATGARKGNGALTSTEL